MILSSEVSRLVVGFTILLLYSCLNTHIAYAATHILKDPATMVSEKGSFVLGFFSPPDSRNQYLGIWCNNVSVQDYVWVANRNHPLADNSGVLRISQEGNLEVLSGKNETLWSSNVSSQSQKSSRKVRFLDSGNLLLQESNGTIVWQSFDHPTDSILPNMTVKITSSNMKTVLQAWKSPSDPSVGRFSFGIDSLTHPQVIIWDGDKRHWRTGPWNGNIFLGLIYADPTNNYADTYMQIVSQEEADFVYTGISTMVFSHYKFDYEGRLNENAWNNSGKGNGILFIELLMLSVMFMLHVARLVTATLKFLQCVDV